METVSSTEGNNDVYPKMMDGLRKVFDTGRTLSVAYREHQLDRIYDMVNENYEDMLAALNKDFKKARFEAATYELEMLKTEAKKIRKELRKWEQREWLPFNILIPFDSACIKRDPYGVVLIIGPFNYPFLLLLQPLIGAIAAGNVAVLKPSENVPHVAAKIAELVPRYLDPECYKVVQGNVQDTIQLLEQRFDYIFATSSTSIGKSIMKAAAVNLTPCTLELGGKSPVYVDDDSDFEITAKRILWGKCINSGQTCIAPDYILCSKKFETAFVENAQKYLKEWYGEVQKDSSDFTRIVNANHFKRLTKLLNETKGKVAFGGEVDSDQMYISPTVVVDIKESDVLMADELFGPILPIITINSKEDALKFIKSRPKPLALYVFSRSKPTLEYFIENSSSGAVCCNDVVVQNGWEGLPFGGVGESGMSRYHGKYSYDTFTHEKSIVIRNFSKTGESMGSVRYPPYTEKNMQIISMFMRNFQKFNITKGRPLAYIMSFVVGVVSTVCVGAKWVLDKKQSV